MAANEARGRAADREAGGTGAGRAEGPDPGFLMQVRCLRGSRGLGLVGWLCCLGEGQVVMDCRSWEVPGHFGGGMALLPRSVMVGAGR